MPMCSILAFCRTTLPHPSNVILETDYCEGEQAHNGLCEFSTDQAENLFDMFHIAEKGYDA